MLCFHFVRALPILTSWEGVAYFGIYMLLVSEAILHAHPSPAPSLFLYVQWKSKNKQTNNKTRRNKKSHENVARNTTRYLLPRDDNACIQSFFEMTALSVKSSLKIERGCLSGRERWHTKNFTPFRLKVEVEKKERKKQQLLLWFNFWTQRCAQLASHRKSVVLSLSRRTLAFSNWG